MGRELKRTAATHLGSQTTDTRPPLRSEPRGHIFHLLLLLTVFLTVPIVCRPQGALTEYQVKAAYLFNFLKFVDWPEDAFPDPLAPIVIAVVGDDPFGPSLPQVVIGKTVQGRDLVIRAYREGENLRSAHILFISASEKKRVPAILSSLRGSSVLTVADMDGFLECGGMIQFVSESNRVRFSINADAARRGRLQVSSKLLSLSKPMEGKAKDCAY